MKRASSWLWGAVLIILGVILGINALGIADINIFFPGWWTLFIIIPSLIALFTEKRKGGPVLGLVIGVCLLLSSLKVIPFSFLWKMILPVILVIIGLTMVLRGMSRGEVADKIDAARKRQAEERKSRHIVEAEVVEEETDKDEDDDDDDDDDENPSDYAEYWSTFGDQNVDYSGKEFKGCRVDAVFGGADIDLRKAKIMNEAILRVSSIFGGIIVYVPDDVKVEVSSTSIFGGVSDKRKNAKNTEAKKTLYIEGSCVFGGVEIR